MKTMSSREIKDRYGAFVEAARREPVVHTSHGRPTLVTISIDRANTIPELRGEINAVGTDDIESRLARFHALQGVGVKLVGPQSDEELEARSRFFRGTDE